jgi:hypothetical protein
MVNSLAVFERFFGPSDGNSIELLEVTDPDTKDLWRLEYVFDDRFKPSKYWAYQFFSGSSYEKDYMQLKTSEVYGFLKAKHPKYDAETNIREAVTQKLNKLIRELE